MDVSGAKAALLRHLECMPEDDTLLGWLRPYRGVQDRHLTEILHALLVVAPELNGPAAVDRGLVHAVWELCRTVRAWTLGPHEPMFHGRQFIAAASRRLGGSGREDHPVAAPRKSRLARVLRLAVVHRRVGLRP